LQFEVIFGHIVFRSFSLTSFLSSGGPQVNKMLPTSHGLLLERRVHSTSSSAAASLHYPSLFLLTNPLNEIAPLLFNDTRRLEPEIGYVTPKSTGYPLVDQVGDDLVLLYCPVRRSHLVCRLRPINRQEVEWIRSDLQKMDTTALTIGDDTLLDQPMM